MVSNLSSKHKYFFSCVAWFLKNQETLIENKQINWQKLLIGS